MTRIPLLALASAALLLVPGRAAAQASLRPGGTAFASLARLEPAAAPVAGPEALAAVASPRGERHQGVVLMIVGAAGIVTGLLVDEPIVTVAGAAVGGVGLYMYLDSGGKVGLRVPTR